MNYSAFPRTALAILSTLLVPAFLAPSIAQPSVSSDGRAQYSHSISMPPGRGGAPSVSLSYGGGDSAAGYGWSVSAGGTVHRCIGTKYLDGHYVPVRQGADDKLCLNGSRLVPVDGQGLPVVGKATGDALGLTGDAFREYRLERNPQVRVRAYGAGATLAMGPRYFKVWGTDGGVSVYGPESGADTHQTLETHSAESMAGTVLRWNLASQTDINGASRKYFYQTVVTNGGFTLFDIRGTRDLYAPSNGGKQTVLKEIQYGPGNKVVFDYATRVVMNKGARSESITMGHKDAEGMLLRKITTYVNAASETPGDLTGAVAVQTTKLSFTKSEPTSRPLLTAIETCAGTGATGRCLPVGEFGYTPTLPTTFTAKTGVGLPTLTYYYAKSADFNSDGRTDVSLNGRVYFGNADGTFTDSGWTTWLGGSQDMVADFNNDGRPDVFSFPPPGDSIVPARLNLNTGSGFTIIEVTGVIPNHQPLQMAPPEQPDPVLTVLSDVWAAATQTTVIDVNDDGKLDLLVSTLPGHTYYWEPFPRPCLTQVCTRLYLGNGTGHFTEAPTNLANIPLVKRILPPPGGMGMADFNKDGLTDILVTFEANVTDGYGPTLLSQGNGNFTSAPYNFDEAITVGSQKSDVRGDGNLDAYTGLINNFGIQTLQFSAEPTPNGAQRPSGEYAMPSLASLWPSGGDVAIVSTSDFDQDGRDDLLLGRIPPTPCCAVPTDYTETFTDLTLLLTRTTEAVVAPFNVPPNMLGLDGRDQKPLTLFGNFTGAGLEMLSLAQSYPNGPLTTVPHTLYTRQGGPASDMLLTVKHGLEGVYTFRYESAPSSGRVAVDFTPVPDARHQAPAGYIVTGLTRPGAVPGSTLTTEYAFKGNRVSTKGFGGLGYGEKRTQNVAPDGSLMTAVTQLSQRFPHVGSVIREESHLAGLFATTESSLLSLTRHVTCDAADLTTVLDAAVANVENCSTPAPVFKRPFKVYTLSSGKELDGTSLPTSTTRTTVNAQGYPTVVTQSTSDSIGTYVSTKQTAYEPDDATCSSATVCRQWLQRPSEVVEARSVPSVLLPTALGSASAQTLAATLTGELAFGTRPVASSNTLQAVLANTGSLPLGLTPPAAGTVSGAGFSFQATTCTGSLAVGAFCNVTVQFSPATVGALNGTLTLATSAGAKVATLTGAGGQGTVSSSSSSLTFGSVQVAQAATGQSIVLTNTGNGNMAITSVAVTQGQTDFSLTHNCTTLAPGADCTVSVGFTPTAAGARTGTVTVVSDGSNPNASIGLLGTGVAQALTPLTVAGSSLGTNLTPYATSGAHVRWKNTGVGPVTVTAAATASNGASVYTDSGSAHCHPGAVLQSNAECSVYVYWNAPGTYATNVAVTSSAGVSSVAVTAGVTAGLQVAAVDFGAVQTAQVLDRAVVVTNMAQFPARSLQFTTASPFSVVSNDCPTALAAGASCNVVVRYAPTATGASSGTTSVSAVYRRVMDGTERPDMSGVATVYSAALSGSGQAASATVSQNNWGTQAVGSTNSGGAQTITNTGVGPVSLTGTPTVNAPFAYLSNNCPTPIPAGAQCQVFLSFSPSDTQGYTQTLSVPTSAGVLTSVASGTGLGSKPARTSAATQAFAPVWYGQAASTLSLTYKNEGNAAMTLGSPSPAAPLAIAGNTCSNIAPQDSCSITVRRDTNVPGLAQSQTLTPTSNGLAATGTSVSWSTYTAVPRWDVTTLSFGDVPVGQPSVQNIVLHNDGNQSYNWASNATLVNAPAGVVFNFNGCSNVAPGTSCTVSVTFTPTARQDYNGSGIALTASSLPSNSLTVTGRGTGASLTLAVTTALPNYSAYGVGTGGVLTVTNSGNVAATGLAVGISNAAPANVSWGQVGGSNSCIGVTTLAAGASCNYYVSVSSPTSTHGVQTATWAVSTTTPGSSPASAQVNLSVTAGAALARLTSTSEPSFGSVWMGAAAPTVTLNYVNDGNLPLTLDGSPGVLGAPFSVVSNTCVNTAPTNSCSYVVSLATTTPALNQQRYIQPPVNGGGNAYPLVTAHWSVQSAVPRWEATSLPFGDVPVNQSSVQNVVLRNKGNTAYNWSANRTLTSTPAGFTFNFDGCTNVVPEGSCTVPVTFAPVARQSYSGSGIALTGPSSAENTLAVSGRGTGASLALVVTTPPPDYHAQSVSSGGVLTVTNNGNVAAAGFEGVALNRSPADSTWGYGSGADSCSGVTSLAAGASCKFYLQISSQSGTPGPQSATWQVSTTTPGSSPASAQVNLAVTAGAPIAQLQSTSEPSFGSVWYGSAPVTITMRYKNIGNAPLTFYAGPDAMAAPLSVQSTTCVNTAPQAECDFVVALATNVAGLNQMRYIQPVIIGGGPSPYPLATAHWSVMTAVPRWDVTSLTFPDTAVGTTSQRSILLYNDGNTPYNWAANGAVSGTHPGFQFTFSGCSAVPAGGACTVTVSFSPTAATGYAASGLVFTSPPANSTNTLSLSGTGVSAVATLTLTPVSYDFGTQQRDTMVEKVFTLTNTGNVIATGLSASAFETGAPNGSSFYVTGNTCTSILGVQSSCSITVVFATACGSGSLTGQLTVTAANASSRTSTLYGTTDPTLICQ